MKPLWYYLERKKKVKVLLKDDVLKVMKYRFSNPNDYTVLVRERIFMKTPMTRREV